MNNTSMPFKSLTITIIYSLACIIAPFRYKVAIRCVQWKKLSSLESLSKFYQLAKCIMKFIVKFLSKRTNLSLSHYWVLSPCFIHWMQCKNMYVYKHINSINGINPWLDLRVLKLQTLMITWNQNQSHHPSSAWWWPY